MYTHVCILTALSNIASSNNQWHSQPNNLVPVCKFQIIVRQYYYSFFYKLIPNIVITALNCQAGNATVNYLNILHPGVPREGAKGEFQKTTKLSSSNFAMGTRVNLGSCVHIF